jgi:hypothetical protein
VRQAAGLALVHKAGAMPRWLSRGSPVSPAALRALADAAEALARLAREAASGAEGGQQDGALVPLREAARLAATSVRVVRDAIRKGDLGAYGRMRDRALRRVDLEAWIASRQVRPVRGVDDADIRRRMARLARTKVRPGPSLAEDSGPENPTGTARRAMRRAGT